MGKITTLKRHYLARRATALLAAFACLTSIGNIQAQDAEIQAEDALPLAKLMTVKSGQGFQERVFFGRVAARQTVDLAFQVGGQIVDFPAVEGETMAKDGLIAKLDEEPFQLALDQATAQRDQAERALGRLEKLSGSSVSRASVEDARTQAELTRVKVREAERALGLSTLTAPFDALVAARKTAAFSTIAAGAPIVRLHDMSELRIEIDVPEVLFAQAGRDPDFEIFARFPASDQAFPVMPREFNAETSPIGQTFSITLGLVPPKDLVILPGSSVSVIVRLKVDEAPMTIPVSALITANDGSASVLVFSPSGGEEGTVARRPIDIAPGSDGQVNVVGGLEPGAEIVAAGATLLNDGDKVRRFNGFPN